EPRKKPQPRMEIRTCSQNGAPISLKGRAKIFVKTSQKMRVRKAGRTRDHRKPSTESLYRALMSRLARLRVSSACCFSDLVIDAGNSRVRWFDSRRWLLLALWWDGGSAGAHFGIEIHNGFDAGGPGVFFFDATAGGFAETPSEVGIV